MNACNTFPAAARLTALVLGLAALPGTASEHSFVECQQGSEFIRNAALSRDNGYERDRFLHRMRDDFLAIRAFPESLRWFVRDDSDEGFLLRAAMSVFDRPMPAAAHEAEFLGICALRSAALREDAPALQQTGGLE
jgi:hypothetical protein